MLVTKYYYPVLAERFGEDRWKKHLAQRLKETN